MTSAVHASGQDLTGAPHLFRSGAKLGALTAVFVLLFSLVSRRLEGSLETTLEAVIVVVGLCAVTILPGWWTRPRTIEGIAGAAGIGLAASWTFLLIDVTVLQRIGTYGHRWLAIGGGSNWWYHPVWWMLGTYFAWMGAWIQANQTAKAGAPSPAGLVMSWFALGAVLAVIAILAHFPGAQWNLPTFAIATIPGLALATLLSRFGAGARRA
jgi:hypothetical protein